MCKTFDLVEGNEWFGRNKAVDISKTFELKQTREKQQKKTTSGIK